jgi:hypothetical protein
LKARCTTLGVSPLLKSNSPVDEADSRKSRMLLGFLQFAKMSWGFGETWGFAGKCFPFVANAGSNSACAVSLEFAIASAQNLYHRVRHL